MAKEGLDSVRAFEEEDMVIGMTVCLVSGVVQARLMGDEGEGGLSVEVKAACMIIRHAIRSPTENLVV